MADINININPQDVINDLLRQITELTGQNAVLRAALNQLQQSDDPATKESE